MKCSWQRDNYLSHVSVHRLRRILGIICGVPGTHTQHKTWIFIHQWAAAAGSIWTFSFQFIFNSCVRGFCNDASHLFVMTAIRFLSLVLIEFIPNNLLYQSKQFLFVLSSEFDRNIFVSIIVVIMLSPSSSSSSLSSPHTVALSRHPNTNNIYNSRI